MWHTHREWWRTEQVGSSALLTVVVTLLKGVQRFYSFVFRKMKRGEHREYFFELACDISIMHNLPIEKHPERQFDNLTFIDALPQSCRCHRTISVFLQYYSFQSKGMGAEMQKKGPTGEIIIVLVHQLLFLCWTFWRLLVHECSNSEQFGVECSQFVIFGIWFW